MPKDGKKKAGRCTLLRAFRVMWDHPNLGKAVLASGLQGAGASVANMLAIQPLQAMYWQDKMAQYGSIFSMCSTLIAIIGSGPFGRFSDQVDRRIAAGLFGLATFLPAWSLIVVGQNELGLFVSQIAQVISGFVSATNAMLVLTNDVTPEELRGVAFGLFYTVNNAMLFTLQSIPPAVGMSPFSVLMFQLCISIGFFMLVMTIDVHSVGEKGKEKEMESNSESNMEMIDSEKEESDVEEDMSSRWTLREMRKWNPIMAMLRPMMLAWGQPELRGLCICAAILSISSGIIFMTSSQYYRSELNLFPYGTQQQQQMVSFVSALPGEILVIPGYMLMGILDTSFGSLTMLRWFIPLRSIMIFGGIGLHFAPTMMMKWCLVPVTDILTTYGSLVYLPLNRLIADYSAGRVGEAMGALGQVQQIASQVANVPIAMGLTQYLHDIGISNPEWLYYAFAAIIGVFGVLPAARMRPPAESLEGKKGEERALQITDAIFHTIDTGGKGHVKFQEVMDVVRDTGKDPDAVQRCEKNVHRFCKKFDIDPNGTFTYEQLHAMVLTRRLKLDDENFASLTAAVKAMEIKPKPALERKLTGKYLPRGSTLVRGETIGPRKPSQIMASRARAYSCELSTRTAYTLDARPTYLPCAMTSHAALELHLQHTAYDVAEGEDSDSDSDNSVDSDDDNLPRRHHTTGLEQGNARLIEGRKRNESF